MKRISSFRRHRIAGPILVVAALFTIGTAFGVASALPSAQSTMTTGTSTLVSEGKAIFLRGCSSCHGLHAEGGSIAPSLIGVGSASVDFQVGTGRMPMADMSQQAIIDPVGSNESKAIIDKWMNFYINNQEKIQNFLINKGILVDLSDRSFFSFACCTLHLHIVTC